MAFQFTSAGAGNWSSTTPNAPWPSGIVPTANATVRINHAVTMDVDSVLGASQSTAIVGTGTITIGPASQVLAGVGTAFLTELKVGDTIQGSFYIESVTSDTAATISTNGTVAGGTALSIRPCALYIQTPGTLTLAAGKKLTFTNDVVFRQSTFTQQAGSQVLSDNSLVPSTPTLRFDICGGGLSTYFTNWIATGTSGSICKVNIAAGTFFKIIGTARSGIDWTYLDLDNVGNSANKAIDIGITANTVYWRMNNVRIAFNGGVCGQFANGTQALAADFSMKNVQWYDAINTASANDLDAFAFTAGTPTGTRIWWNNVAQHPLKDMHININVAATGFDVRSSMFGRLDMPVSSGPMANFSDVLFHIRNVGANASTNWSFVGVGGDTLTGCYVQNDEGQSQLAEHETMANDTPGVGGTWAWNNATYERTTPGPNVRDAIHLPTPTAAWIMAIDKMLVLPSSTGRGSGVIRGRGSVNTTMTVTRSTLMIDPPLSGAVGFTNSGALLIGDSYAGGTGIVAKLQDCLGWSKTQFTPVSGRTAGALAVYTRDQGSPVADCLTAANITNNAHYNANSGTIYDAAGTTPTSALGYDGWRQTVKPTLATDVNLGTGTNESTQGPQFVDTSRNFATFSSVYLLAKAITTTPATWADATPYIVGDRVKCQSAAFYGNAVIWFRCVAAHTSAAASATLGQPGSATTDVATGYPSGYRVTWEFDTAYQMRELIRLGTTFTDATLALVAANPVLTLNTWVRYGFQVQAPALKTASSTGGVIGAGQFLSPGGAGPWRRWGLAA